MIILGDKYKITALEEQQLLKKKYKIKYISYDKKNLSTIKKTLNDIVSNTEKKIVVINTELKVDKNFFGEDKKIQIVQIEDFLEDYLYKCYIPQSESDSHNLDSIKPLSKFQFFQKRAIDFFGIFWLFIFSFFVMQKCKKKIHEESPGDIYFRQKRVGLHDKEFECVKFRSMHEKSEFFSHYTQENDPRIFSWGEHMRKRRYDELPQMLNILKGEMHLIGPRTEWNELVNKYKNEIPFYSLRHIVAPGITGWAQVMYPYGTSVEDAKQKLMYDLYYIKHWNILLELKIVWLTAMVVISKKGV